MAKRAPEDILRQSIKADFKKYWGIENKSLTIGSILSAQRWGCRISKLPQEIQELLRSPEVTEAWGQWFESVRALQSHERWKN